MNRKDAVVTHYVVPAQPGYAILSHWPEEDGSYKQLGQDPIVAFAITRRYYSESERTLTEVDPITVEGDPASNELAILKPDGRISLPSDRDFDSKEEYLAYLNSQKEKK